MKNIANCLNRFFARKINSRDIKAIPMFELQIKSRADKKKYE